MRLENIEVIFRIKLPVNKPDGNGVIYTEEAIRNAYESAQNRDSLPIEFINNKGEFLLIGNTQGLKLIEENGELYVVGCGLIYHGGTEEQCEAKNKTVSDFHLMGIGICEN